MSAQKGSSCSSITLGVLIIAKKVLSVVSGYSCHHSSARWRIIIYNPKHRIGIGTAMLRSLAIVFLIYLAIALLGYAEAICTFVEDASERLGYCSILKNISIPFYIAFTYITLPLQLLFMVLKSRTMFIALLVPYLLLLSYVTVLIIEKVRRRLG